MPENDHDWIHQSSVCLLVKRLLSCITPQLFCPFLNFPPNFYQCKGDSRSCACYKDYGVDKLTDIWNLYKEESARPKFTLYLRSVENIVVYILWWLAIILMSIVFFCLICFFNCETSNIETFVAVSVYSVGKAWNWSDGFMPRQGQHFNPLLLFIIALAGRVKQHVHRGLYIFIIDSKRPQ